MAWVESHSLSFSARHESAHADAGERGARRPRAVPGEPVDDLFEVTPSEIAVVMHARSIALSLAHPWLPLARRVAAPASRRYFAGWFAEHEIHVLAPNALERRASAVPGSREALLLTPRHEYAHLVLGANNPGPPAPVLGLALPPVRALGLALRGGRRVALGPDAAASAPAIVRRHARGRAPRVPAGAVRRDAAGRHRLHAAGAPARHRTWRPRWPRARSSAAPAALLAEAFDRPVAAVERDWRDELDSMAAVGLSAPSRAPPYSPSVFAMMFFWISDVPP